MLPPYFANKKLNKIVARKLTSLMAQAAINEQKKMLHPKY